MAHAVLVVEDQARLADDIAMACATRASARTWPTTARYAIEGAAEPYDAVLDRDLPRIHGDAVCASLVGSPSQARILMLTAAGTVGDRVDGLNLGADDYLAKPFVFAELVARVRSLARRSPAAAPVIARGGIVLDRARRRVSRAGRLVPLNRKELGVLEELLIADGGIRSAEDPFERVWDESTDLFSRTVTVTIARLRQNSAGQPGGRSQVPVP
jgi:DNA-binding response OmpR family regulator